MGEGHTVSCVVGPTHWNIDLQNPTPSPSSVHSVLWDEVVPCALIESPL